MFLVICYNTTTNIINSTVIVITIITFLPFQDIDSLRFKEFMKFLDIPHLKYSHSIKYAFSQHIDFPNKQMKPKFLMEV